MHDQRGQSVKILDGPPLSVTFQEKHKEWCIQLIGRICEIKTYLQWTRVCIFFFKERTTLSGYCMSWLHSQQSKDHSSNLLLRKHTEGLSISQVKKQVSHFTGKQMWWWVTRAYGEPWHCKNILGSPGTNSARPWPQTSPFCVVSSVIEDVHGSSTELKFPFRRMIWSSIYKI